MAGASLDLQLTISNAAEVKATFERLDAALADLTPAFQDIGEALLNRTRERFSTQTAPDGTPWAALSPDYAQRKKKNKDKILTLSGHLRGLLNYQAGPCEVRIGTPLIYGATHQFGAPERNIPARPFLGLSSADETELLDILQDHLRRALER
ncbi:MAG: phage virion morphogenesis protein [Candidatus Competibacter sp.]|nr:phage virion morphogenesis protein [Candidatus Competibacter sp.]MDG4606468.1 phage virion morphogenesis protein [Candidatus Contendobacter sp.]MDS4059280.1 phage virion morphogenesis protein [Candidatus Contendobacter sp.]